MTAVLLLGEGLPLLNRLFPPVPLIEQVQNTPTLIFVVLMGCLAAAYLALWRAAPDFRAFRILGIFFALVALSQSCDYFGGLTLDWSLRALASGMLVETAGEAMQVPRRGWTLLFWPIYLFASIAVWFPKFVFYCRMAGVHLRDSARHSDFPGAQAQKRTRQDDCRRIPVLLIRAPHTFQHFPTLHRHEGLLLYRRMALAVHPQHADPAGNRDAGHLCPRPDPRPPREAAHGR